MNSFSEFPAPMPGQAQTLRERRSFDTVILPRVWFSSGVISCAETALSVSTFGFEQ
jgi:hypothetical protein